MPPVRPASFVPPRPVPTPAGPLRPPGPPPLPRIGPPALVGFTLLLLGLALVTDPALVGVSDVYGLPLGLLALAAGLGWLVLRLWPAPPTSATRTTTARRSSSQPLVSACSRASSAAPTTAAASPSCATRTRASGRLPRPVSRSA